MVFGLTGAFLVALLGGLEILPVRLSVVALALVSPTVLSLCILVGPDRRIQGQIFLCYGAVLAVFCGLVWAIGTPELSLDATGELGQPGSMAVTLPGSITPALICVIYASPSVFLLLFLNRTVRAIGALVLVFFFIVLAGSHVAISVLEAPAIMGLAVDLAVALGLGSLSVFWSIFGLGLAAGPSLHLRIALGDLAFNVSIDFLLDPAVTCGAPFY